MQLNNRFYNASVQEVSPDNGPVTVFIGELNKQYVFLCVCVCVGVFINSTSYYFFEKVVCSVYTAHSMLIFCIKGTAV